VKETPTFHFRLYLLFASDGAITFSAYRDKENCLKITNGFVPTQR
jgi:hypothetical protein